MDYDVKFLTGTEKVHRENDVVTKPGVPVSSISNTQQHRPEPDKTAGAEGVQRWGINRC